MFWTFIEYFKRGIIKSSMNEKIVEQCFKRIAIILSHTKFKENYPDSTGTDCDASNLEQILPQLGFECKIYNNLKFDEVIDLRQKLQNEYDLTRFDSLIIIVLSYGGSSNAIEAYDKEYNLATFIDEFRPLVFPEMSEKPKLFFVSTCRGENAAATSSVSLKGNYQTDSKETIIERHTLYKNLLIIYATTENAFSIRDTKNGTIFIQTFNETATNFVRDINSNKLDIMEFFRIMNNNLIQRGALVNGAKVKQMAQILSTLKQPYYFEK